jgi:hypothetical protein
MSIKQVTTELTGEIGVTPRIVRIYSDDNYATVTSAGYLDILRNQGYFFKNTDIAAVTYSSNPPVTQFFNINITNNVTTLTPVGPDVELPSIDGRVVVFDGTAGALKNGNFNQNVVLTAGIVNPDSNANLFSFNVQCLAGVLGSGGSVVLVNSSGSKQYRIKQLQTNSGNSFSTGDRLGAVTDGTTVFSLIPAVAMQAMANAQWGSVGLPFPASAPLNTTTAAGANLIFQYSGGSSDYVSGLVTISGLIERVA